MIHCYKFNGDNIVMDVNSGSVHVVDDVAYDVIERYEGESREDIVKYVRGKYSESEISDQELDELFDDIESLKAEGTLFTEDTYKEGVLDFKARKTVVKALCLHIAHACNLSCRYCFAGEGEYKGDRSLMSYETGKKALDFLVANSGSRVNLEVDFFGGEPLMNFDVVKQLVEYGRSLEEKHNKNFRFTLTTNGMLLNDDIIEFVNKEMDNVVLSIDGRREIHDYMRPDKAGNGSYDKILPWFKKVAESRNQTRYYVRGTFTRHNLDFVKDVLHLADLGFEQVSVEPVVADPSEDYAIREEDLPTIFKGYEELATEMLRREKEGRGFTFFHYMIDLTGGPCVYKRLSGCGSGTEYLSVTPWGDLYPCHQFVGNEEFLLGNVDDGIQNVDIVNEFKLCNVYAKKECRDCFAKFYCSGGCAANAYNTHQDINKPYEIGCELQRKRTECAIWIKAKQAEEN
ncbi:thioether cross-link-forming SCIFF peptide maturase [Eubacterium xylanophilum]|uniref:thioether cross-link-forming SCIFF peptide maturase n=1 Tax=Eubacterium xylanophilum TaxID=39497 RepID=UPI000479E11E|nr:thioether cross-link-forming SCIFF peptide maturase [Eubacterium xylanophilum]